MAKSYIPAKDSLLLVWALNFSALLSANPATYGLTAGDAAAVAAATTAFQDAYTIATTDNTRTKVTIAAKDTARGQMLILDRSYANIIQANLGISQEDKTALGLTIRDKTPTRIEPPQTSPILSIIGATPMQHTLRYADQNTPTKRAKPAGAIFLQIFVQVGVTAPASPEATPYKMLATKNPVGVNFAAGDVGKQAFYYGRWVNKRGEVGPWSNMTEYTIV